MKFFSPLAMSACVTIAWIAFIVWWIYSTNDTACVLPEEQFLRPLRCLDLNEFGDLLAGAFSFLAFFWLAIAVFLQRSELIAQHHEQLETRKALQAQSKHLERQTKILSAREFDREFETLLMQICKRLSEDFRRIRFVDVNKNVLTVIISSDKKRKKMFKKGNHEGFLESYLAELKDGFFAAKDSLNTGDLELQINCDYIEYMRLFDAINLLQENRKHTSISVQLNEIYPKVAAIGDTLIELTNMYADE